MFGLWLHRLFVKFRRHFGIEKPIGYRTEFLSLKAYRRYLNGEITKEEYRKTECGERTTPIYRSDIEEDMKKYNKNDDDTL